MHHCAGLAGCKVRSVVPAPNLRFGIKRLPGEPIGFYRGNFSTSSRIDGPYVLAGGIIDHVNCNASHHGPDWLVGWQSIDGKRDETRALRHAHNPALDGQGLSNLSDRGYDIRRVIETLVWPVSVIFLMACFDR